MDQYLRTIPEEHMIRHRYQTTVKYLTLMIVIHVCVMSFFSVKIVSNRIADKTDSCTHTTMYGLRIVMIQGLSKSLSKNAKQK